MNFLILGDGPEERAWAAALADSPGHRILAAYPGLDGPDDPADLEDALAVPGVEAVVAGGDFEFRAEALRRAAAEGLAVVVTHPPGPDSEAYYLVALSREETGAVVVPHLPARLHPGVARLADAIKAGELGAFRELRYEATVESPDGVAERDLARVAFSKAVDVVRALLGDIDAVNATGDPAGVHPDQRLVVQLRARKDRRAEVRLSAGTPGPVRLTLTGASGAMTLELPADLAGPAGLVRRSDTGPEAATSFDPWDPHGATLAALEDALNRRPTHPDLHDATRASEVAEGAVRSLRRGRTVELHYEDISEEANFKGIMTSFGCMVLLAVLFVIPVALAGPALGMGWTIYLAYAVPPVLTVFLVLQLLRFAARRPAPLDTPDPPPRDG